MHRYHYPEHPLDLPVGFRQAVGNTLTLTYRDRDVTPADLVLELLSAFCEQIARANRGSAAPRADATQ